MPSQPRRTFSRALAGAALSAASSSRVLGANDRPGLALIGCGRRGREVMEAFLKTGRADLRCLCDVYDAQRARARSLLGQPFECVAHEKALARRDVDAVLIATADHWHLDIALDALRAGKHVYLEKPATHRFEEGAALLAAARSSGRVCQVGTQQRSGAHYRRAKEEVFGPGKLGKVLFVRAAWSGFPWQARAIPKAPKPDGLDWVRYLGRTGHRDFEMARYDSWRCFPEYGGGVLADILNHWADVAQWMMDDPAPVAAVAAGGIYQLHDHRVNPDTVNAIVQYKDWNLAFESSVLPAPNVPATVVFVGTHGTLDLSRDGFIYRNAAGAILQRPAEGSLETAHVTDFLDSLKTGKRPSADVAIGLQGVLPCHLARAAFWSGKRARYAEGTIKV